MANYPTKMQQPGALARATTDEYVVCGVCETQQPVQSPNRDDAKFCAFCGAPAGALHIFSEAPDYEGAVEC